MGKKTAGMLFRPHEQYRRVKFEQQLAGIRIYYTVFCLGVLFLAQKHLQVLPAVLIIFSFIALGYSFIRYLKPTDLLKKRHFPPAADWLDFLLIAILIYLTGGIKGFFFVAYAMPLCGGIMRFGLKAGMAGYAAALALTGLMYFINTVSPSVPSSVPLRRAYILLPGRTKVNITRIT